MENKQLDPMLKIVESISQKLLNVDEQLSNIVEKTISEIVRAGLGLENDYDRKFRFFCTNGFKNSLRDLVKSVIEHDVKPKVKETFDALMKNRTFNKNITELFKKEFENEYENALRNELSKLLDEATCEAEITFQKECETLAKAMDNTLVPIMNAARANVLAKIQGETDDER